MYSAFERSFATVSDGLLFYYTYNKNIQTDAQSIYCC